ncbi:PAS domain S-box protein [Hymenobacter pini]|uniref:PAS domain S-box protein n=1 Tax=Hymenobacter pini TaxID=2880879 RepID=UPI001CF46181|nr:PAS domain S-box protein [Hymenobacter pini]MCA8832556.1 PAS domain S-box protein [Hymenobacter pini]
MGPTSPLPPSASSQEPPSVCAALLDALPYGVLVLDEQRMIRRVNQQAAYWCGAPAEKLQGQQLNDAALLPALSTALQQLLEPGEVTTSEIWLPHAQHWVRLQPGPAPAGQYWVFWENVTARHQAEAAQERNSQVLLAVEAVTHTGSYEVELASGSIYFSNGMYRLFGEEPQAFVPTPALISARSDPDDVAAVQQVLSHALRTRQPYTYRRRIRWPGGQQRILEARGEVHCDAAGTPVTLRELVQDITERVEAEHTLQQSQALLRRTIDSSLDLVQVFEAVRNEQGQVVDFRWMLNNAAAEQVYGNVIGQRLCQLNPGVIEEGIFDTFKRVLETGVPDQSERHYVHEQFDGWFYQSTVKLGDGVTTTTHDITARKQAEQELRQTKELLQAVLDSSRFVVQAFRAVRDAEGRIVDFTWLLTNQAWLDNYGGDMTGKSLLRENPGVVETGLFELFMQVTETGAPVDHEQYYAHEQFAGWFHQTLVKLGDGFVMNTVEITERKQAQEEILRLKEELAQQASDRYYSLFATMNEGVSVLEMIYDAADRPVDMRWVEVNPAFERITGLRDVAGKLTSSVMPTEQYWLDAYDSVVRTGQSLRYENDHAGINQWYRTHTSRIGGPESRLVANVFEDVTERKQQETQLRAATAAETFRLELADALAPLNSPVAIQEAVTRTARLHFGADRCYYCEIENGRAIIRRDAAAEGLPSVAGTYPLADFTLLQAVIETGRPFIVHDVRQDPTVDENLRQLCVQLQVISYLDVPVIKNGQPVGVLCLVQSQPRDWTTGDTALAAEVAERTWAAVERARVEEALRDSEATLAAVFDALPVGIGLTATDGRLTLANHQMRRYLPTGIMPSRDATQLSRWHAVGPDGHPLPPTEYPGARAQRGERVVPGLEMLHTPAEGPPVWTQVFAVPMRYRYDQLAGHVTVILDIDARKRAEDALRQSEEKFRTLFESIDEGFCLVELLTDAQGEAVDFHFLEVNPVFARQTGLGAARGRLLSELAPGTEQPWFDTHAQVVRTGQPVRFEQYHADTGRWYEVYSSRVGGPGSQQLALVFSDITERKRREADAALLMAISGDLNLLSGESEMLAAVGAQLTKHLRLTCWHYVDVDEARGEVTLRHFWHEQAVPDIRGTYPIAGFLAPGVVAALRAGTPAVVADVPADISADSAAGLALQAGAAAQQIGAYVAVPYSVGGSWKAYLAVADSRPRPWTEAELALVQDVAARVFPRIERARAEEELRASEDQFRAVANLVPDLLWRSDAAGNRIWYNQGWYEYTGQVPEDAAGYGWTDVIHPDDRAESARRYRAAVASGQLLRQEHRVRSVQGEYRWFQVQARPLHNAQGAVTAWYGAATDIHARKQAELALAAGEQRLQALITNLPGAAVFIVDRELRYQLAEGEALRVVGYESVDFRGRLVHELAPPEQWPRYREQYTQALAGRPFESEHAQGGRTFLTRGVPLPGPDGAVEAVLAVSYDITARKRAEEALRASEAQLAAFNAKLEQRVARRTRDLQASRDLLQSMFDTNLIAMSVLEAVRDEAGAIQDFRLVLVSRELARETGRTDLVGLLYAQQYPGIRDVGIFDLIVRAVETGEPQGMEYFYPHEGFNKWFACQFVKLGDGVVATNLDITARKQAEDERFKNLQLLQQAESLVGLGSWEYDLRTKQFTWSAGMYHLFGIPQGQPVRLGVIFSVITEESRPQAEYIKQCVSTGACDIKETVQLRVNGQVRTVRIRAVVVRDELGQALKVLGMNLDISELKRLEADNLHLRLTQQRALFEAVQTAQEDERKRIAEGLHNGIGQILYATKLRLDRLHCPSLGADPTLLKARAEADQLLADAIRQTRALSHELVPMILQEFGLTAALQDTTRKMSTADLLLNSNVSLDEAAAPLAPALQMALYRIAQELAQNIVKHAHGATMATLELETMPGWVLLRAEDNGPGFATVSATRPGLGLRTIRDRVTLLGGQLETGNVLTGGAYVRIRIPLPSSFPNDSLISG